MPHAHTVKAKLTHFFGRTFTGWLQPAELLWLAQEPGVYIKSRDIDFALSRKKLGNSNPMWYYLDIDEPSDFLGRT